MVVQQSNVPCFFGHGVHGIFEVQFEYTLDFLSVSSHAVQDRSDRFEKCSQMGFFSSVNVWVLFSRWLPALVAQYGLLVKMYESNRDRFTWMPRQD